MEILEVGCGPGYLSLELARAGYDLTGIDVSNACIKVAKKYADEDPFKAGRGKLEYARDDFFNFVNAINQQSEQKKFDAVVFLGSLHHFSDIAKVSVEAKKILRTGGLFVCHEPTRDRVTRHNAMFIYFLRVVLSHTNQFFKEYPAVSDHVIFEREIEKIFQEYRYEDAEGGKKQSVHDNDSGFKDMMPVLEKEFQALYFQERSAFFHENIGGLRSDSDAKNYQLARFLKEFDNYLCKSGFLQSIEFFFVGRKA